MKKNKVIKYLVLLLCITSILVIAFSSSKLNFFTNTSEKYTNRETVVRKKYNFNYDWKFAKGSGYINRGSDLQSNPVETYTLVNSDETPYAESYTTDSRWSNVSLNHTFNDIDTFNNFTESGMNGERSQYSGTSWYKKELFIPSDYADKKIYIEFEAARQAAEVYVNGTKLEGKYLNGFIPFGYDLTPYLNVGATNQITVMVDNTYPYYLDGVSYIPWHNPHWHPNFGGLYRNSYLYVMDELHLTLPLYSFIEGEGTYVYTTNENGGAKSATFHVDAEVENNKSTSQSFTLRSTIYDKEGVQKLVMNSETITLGVNEKTKVALSGDMENVIRWSTEYPYMYDVVTEIIQNDTVIDDNVVEFGVRTYRFTNDYGFYLNEHYTELNGWGQKSTMEYAGLGAAYPDWMTDKFIKQMKDAGSNYLRFGHVAGSPAQISAANKYGILVTQPGVDGEGIYDSKDYNGTAPLKLRTEAFRDLIIYYRNNPSIVMWEIGNQTTSTTKTLSADIISSISGLSEITDARTLAALLYYIANKYDYGNRETAVGGTISNAGSYESTISKSERILTIRQGSQIIKNYVEVAETTNGVSTSGMSTQEAGNKPSVESEYNRYESRRSIWNTITNSSFTPQNTYHKTSEQYAIEQIKTFNTMLTASKNTGGANWIYSDSTSHGRVNTEVSRVSGEVDGTFLEKEAYYVDKVLFTDTPSSYLIGHWNYSTGQKLTVYAAVKGATTVKLYVNGTEYSGVLSDKYLWTFSNVSWESGTVSIKGFDEGGVEIPELRDSKTTHGAPAKIRLTMGNNPTGIKANGSDIVLVDAEVIDANNNRCLTYDGTQLNDIMTFTLTGDTDKFIWRGGYNSGIENSTNSNTLYAEAGITRVAIKTTLNSGTVNLSASTTFGLTVENSLPITSSSITNNVGNLTGVNASLNETSPYSLSSLSDPGYGDGAILGIQVTPTVTNSSILISDFSYTGTNADLNGIHEALSVGKKMYNDENVTFTKIPYKYLNAEYLFLPSSDSTDLSADYISFTAKRDIDVYILRDPRVSSPAYLSDYTLVSGDKIIGGNGVEYDIYKKSITKGTFITIGSNIDNLNGLNDGANQIIMFKETEKVNNNVFFYESFDDFNTDSINLGWNAKFSIGNTLSIDSTLSGNTLHLQDTTDKLMYVQKSFSPLSKFKLKFRAYLTDDASSNSWLRVWLTKGKISTPTDIIAANEDKSFLGVETYLDSNSSGVFYAGRKMSALGSENGITQLAVGLSFNAWNTFEVYVDAINSTYTVKINGGALSLAQPFRSSELGTLDNVVFGTWISGNSNYYIDDIEIVPIVDSVIEDLKIDGNPVTSFMDTKYTYNIQGLSSSSTLTFTEKDYYKSSTVSYNNEEQCLELIVTDILGGVWTYKFKNSQDDPILSGWSVFTGSGLSIDPEEFNGEKVIHLLDNTTDTFAYMEREISHISSIYEISFDIYIPNDSYGNQYNRVFLSNKTQAEDATDSKKSVVVETYYEKSNGFLTSRYRNGNTLTLNTTKYSLGSWHNYKILVNETAHTYDLFIDDVVEVTNAAFYHNLDINYLIIGTRKNGTTNNYIKNYQLRDVYNPPLKSITYDGYAVSNFDSNTYEYNIYSEDTLSEESIINITTESYAVSSDIAKNINEQKVIVTVTDSNNEEHTYTLNIFPLSERPVTFEELQTLLQTARSFNADDYTDRSYEEVRKYITECGEYTNNTSNENISLCYYYLETSIAGLIEMIRTDDKSSLINIVNMSADLLTNYNFVKVLENGNNVYKDNNNLTFRSVPKKYMNANYFSFIDTMSSITGEINMTSKRDVTLFILKDRNAGSLIDETFTDTKEIVTATDGTNTVVYKIYSKRYNEDEKIIVDTKTLLTNRITNYPNIIGVKGTSEVSEGLFLKDLISEYNNLEDFNNTWQVYNYDSSSDLTNNDQALELKDGFSSVRMESNAGGATAKKNSFGSTASLRSFIETSRQFAKLDGIFKFSYYGYVEPVSTDYDNNFLRIWLAKDSPSSWEI